VHASRLVEGHGALQDDNLTEEMLGKTRHQTPLDMKRPAALEELRDEPRGWPRSTSLLRHGGLCSGGWPRAGWSFTVLRFLCPCLRSCFGSIPISHSSVLLGRPESIVIVLFASLVHLSCICLAPNPILAILNDKKMDSVSLPKEMKALRYVCLVEPGHISFRTIVLSALQPVDSHYICVSVMSLSRTLTHIAQVQQAYGL
jgi:hypothetical protein